MPKGLSPRLETYEQIAARMQCSVATVRRAVREGAPCLVLGPKTHRFCWVAFSEWLRRRRRWKPPKPAEEIVGDAETQPEQQMEDVA